MSYRRISSVLVLSVVLMTACKKHSSESCEKLKTAIATNNTQDVKGMIGQFINRLPSNDYTAQNLNNLAASLSQCDISATVLCFDCIDTYPGQSEIRLSFTSSGSVIDKTIDVSHSPSDNKMKVVNMHY